MDLVATPKNPIPLGVSGGYLEGKGSVRLRYARWPSALKERHGTVCIFPGRAELIEKYFEVVGELRLRGIGLDEAVAELPRVGRGEADAFDAVHPGDLVDERGEQKHVGSRDDLQRIPRAFPG